MSRPRLERLEDRCLLSGDPLGPVAHFLIAPSEAAPGDVLLFDARSSFHEDSARQIVQYRWDFNNDSVFDVVTADPVVNQSFSIFGHFPVVLEVADDSSPALTSRATEIARIVLGNNAPTAAAGGSYTVVQGAPLLLDGSGSSDPDGAYGDSITSYAWYLDADEVAEIVTAAPQVTLSGGELAGLGLAIGANTIRLRVTDSLGLTGDDAASLELQASDAAFPQMLKNINPAGGSRPVTYAAAGGATFFAASDGVHGSELWKTDGTTAGTVLVKDIAAGTVGAGAGRLTQVGDTLFFVARDANSGSELWKSDGTPEGTLRVKDIYAGSADSGVQDPVELNGVLYFSADDGVHGRELWRSDGTEAGTHVVKDIWPGDSSSGPAYLTNVAGTLFFSGSTPDEGRELWKSDGTEAGTALVRDIVPGSGSSVPVSLTAAGGNLFFGVHTLGRVLWKSDGTEAGTALVHDGSTVEQFSLTDVGGELFFVAGAELWHSDGTPEGTALVLELPGGVNAYLQYLTNVGGTLFFTAHDGTSQGLWKSDGTAAGTTLIMDFGEGADVYDLARVGSKLFFLRTDADNFELWESDGTAAGTHMVADLVPESGGGDAVGLTNVGGRLYSTVTSPTFGSEPWIYDPPGMAGGPYTVAEGGSLVLAPPGIVDDGVEWDLDGDGRFGETGAAALHGDERGARPLFSAVGLDGPAEHAIGLRFDDGSTFAAVISISNAAPSVTVVGAPAVLPRGPIPADLQPGDSYHLMYVSSFLAHTSSDTSIPTDYPNFGGIAAASWNLTFAASDAGLLPEWNGKDIVWNAVLSVSGDNAIDRIPVSGPIYNMQGERLAADKGDLWDGSLNAAVRYNEYGDAVSGNTFVWTGTNSLGNWSGDSAGNWTQQTGLATVGTATDRGSSWMFSAGREANLTARLYGISPAFIVPTATAPRTVETGTLVTLDSAVSDAGIADTHTFVWSVRHGGAGVASGTGPSFSFTPSEPGSYFITLVGTDDDGAAATFIAEVLANDPPIASIEGPAGGVPGQELSFTLHASDSSAADQAAGFQYSIDWDGDGTVDETVAGPDGVQVQHVYTETGAFAMSVVAADRHGAAGAPASHAVTIEAAQVQDGNLLVGGTSSGDTIELQAGSVIVIVNGQVIGSFAPTGRIIVFALDGNDDVRVDAAIVLPAELDGGAGDDRLQGGGGENVLLGREGNDRLVGGSGVNRLDGGEGDDVLEDTGGTNILVGGGGNNTFVPGGGSNTFQAAPGSTTPEVFGDGFATDEDGTLSVPAHLGVLANDSDPLGGQLSAVLTGGPAHGSLSLGADGSLVYVPHAHFSGSDSFRYRAASGTAESSEATVLITVAAVADPPALSALDAAGDEGAWIGLDIAAALVDADGSESLTVQIGGVPAGAVLSSGIDGGGGNWTLSPAQLAGLNILAPDDAAFTLTVTATATEGANAHTASTAQSAQVTVNNVAPATSFDGSSFNLDTGGNAIALSGVRGQALLFSGSLTDPGFNNPLAPNGGTVEGFSYRIDWGDGTADGTRAAAIEAAGSAGNPTAGSFSASHVYAEAGVYTISITVTDDDGGATAIVRTATVAVISLQAGGDLALGGTAAADSIVFSPSGNAGDIEATLNGESLGVYQPTGRLLAFGQDGNDDIQVAGSIGLPAWLYGGAGHDRLKGGGGHDVLLGQEGDDLLVGGGGRDLLIGGVGADRIVGNADDDILIAGFTLHDASQAALEAIMAEWTLDEDFATRTSNLRAEYLKTEGTAATVFDDGAKDVLTGSEGQDWFFANLVLDDGDDSTTKDKITDMSTFEQLFAEDLDFIYSG